MSAAQTTGSSPTGRHRWWVPRCTTASPGPRTTGAVVRQRELEPPGEHDVDVDGRGGVPPRFTGVEPGWVLHGPEADAPPPAWFQLPRRPRGRRPGRVRQRAAGLPQLDQRRAAASDRRGRRAVGEHVRAAVLVGGGHEPARPVAIRARRRLLLLGRRRRVGIGTQHAHDVGARVVADHAPAVAVAALDHDVTRPELVLAVVETEHDATVDHDHEVERVGGVHARLVGVVALHPDPVAAAFARAGEADDAHRAATDRGLQPDGSVRFVAPVVDRRRRPIEPQPRGHGEPVGPDRVRRLAIGQDHRPTLSVVPGDDPSCSQLVVCGCHAADPTQPSSVRPKTRAPPRARAEERRPKAVSL